MHACNMLLVLVHLRRSLWVLVLRPRRPVAVRLKHSMTCIIPITWNGIKSDSFFHFLFFSLLTRFLFYSFFHYFLLFVLIHCTALKFTCTVLCSWYTNLDKVYNEVRLDKRHHRQGIHLSFVLFSWYCATVLERFNVEGFRIHYTGPTSLIH